MGRLAQMTGILATSALVSCKKNMQKNTLPKRILGRTGVRVSMIGLGLGPLGLGGYTKKELQQGVKAAIEEGIGLFDMQPDYGNSESWIAPVIKDCQDEVFLMTKTWEQSKEKVIAQIQESARRLNVECIDAVLINNIGKFDLKTIFGTNGTLAGLKAAQKQGLVRFIGVSGHTGVDSFVHTLDTGEFDILMTVINYVDRHTYNFEGKVLPIAAKHNVGVVAMKVLGGAVDWDYSTRMQRAMITGKDYEPAIRYALGVPGVCTAVIGCKNIEEINLATVTGRSYQPLSKGEQDALFERGKQMAEEWGSHFGPV